MGNDLRLLSIAVALLTFPPVILFDDPFRYIDSYYSINTLKIMKKLAARGHTIICTLSFPENFEIEGLDSVVLLSGGFSIYSGRRDSVEKYFTSRSLGYKLSQGQGISEFLLNISSGLAEPEKENKLSSLDLAYKFYSSEYSEKAARKAADTNTDTCYHAYNERGIQRWHFSNYNSVYCYFYQLYVLIVRTFLLKFREKEVLVKSFMGAIILSLFIGLMLHGQVGLI